MGTILNRLSDVNIYQLLFHLRPLFYECTRSNFHVSCLTAHGPTYAHVFKCHDVLQTEKKQMNDKVLVPII